MGDSVAGRSHATNKSLSKRFTNGHVCFVAAQQKAYQELLKKEFEKRERFEKHKMEFVMPRNPLIGEPTPREGEGRPLINTYWPEPESPTKKPKKDITMKIGVDDTKYQFLGNSPSRQQHGRSGVLSNAGRASLGRSNPGHLDAEFGTEEEGDVKVRDNSTRDEMVSRQKRSATSRSEQERRSVVTGGDDRRLHPGGGSGTEGMADSSNPAGQEIKQEKRKKDLWESQGNDF